MFGLSATEIVVILMVALLVFGPKRLPAIARRLGRTLGEFRKAADELKDGFASDLMKTTPENPSSGSAAASGKETLAETAAAPSDESAGSSSDAPKDSLKAEDAGEALQGAAPNAAADSGRTDSAQGGEA